MSDTPSHNTTDVILDGAMRALARHGAARMSMTDICREAGVSRGTLYRYFANREDVLEAVNARILEVNRELFDAAIAERPDPADRVRVVLHVMLDFPRIFPHMRVLFEYEPEASLRFLGREADGVVASIANYLRPGVPTSRSRDALTAEDLAALLYRVVTSSFLIPTKSPEEVEEMFMRLWSAVEAEAPGKKANGAGAPFRRATSA